MPEADQPWRSSDPLKPDRQRRDGVQQEALSRVVQVLEEGAGRLIPVVRVDRSKAAGPGVHSVTRSRSEIGAATVPGPTRAAVNCRRWTRHVQEILYVRSSADCVDDPGGEVAPSRQVKGSVPTPDRCDHALVTPVYWHEDGGGVLPGLSGELSAPAGGGVGCRC